MTLNFKMCGLLVQLKYVIVKIKNDVGVQRCSCIQDAEFNHKCEACNDLMI